MTDDMKKPKLEVVSEEELDEEEQEFRSLRTDLPGVKGASAVGIVTINVAKVPGRNEFFRTHPEFRPSVPLVDHQVGLEKQYFAVTPDMVVSLASIGISVAPHTLYLTVTARGAVQIIPIRHINFEGVANEYARTKELALVAGTEQWVRMYTDTENHSYMVFPAPAGRFPDPIWPVLKQAKIFRLAFRDKGRLVDSPEHPLVKQWAAR